MLEQINVTLNSIAAVVVILGLCIFFHELGHFIVAKLSRMKVEEFAFGLGPVLAGFRRGETLYSIHWVPFGGFVRIAGMEPGERQVPRGFFSRPRPLQAATIIAGVLMNVVLAVGLFFVVNLWEGMPVEDSRKVFVGSVLKGQPAAQAGLQPGDRLVSADGERYSLWVEHVAPQSPADRAGLTEDSLIMQVEDLLVYTPTDLLLALRELNKPQVWLGIVGPPEEGAMPATLISTLDVPEAILSYEGELTASQAAQLTSQELGASFEPIGTSAVAGYIGARPDTPLKLQVERDGQLLDIAVTPRRVHDRIGKLDPSGRLTTPIAAIGRIGITLRPETRPAKVGEALEAAAIQSVMAVTGVVHMVAATIAGKISPSSVAGPVGIIAMTAEQAKYGWQQVLNLGGVISANLAVINLVPIPPLDGFWLVLIAFEGLTRKSVNHRIELAIRFAGIVIILGLFLGLVAKDVYNLTMFGVP